MERVLIGTGQLSPQQCLPAPTSAIRTMAERVRQLRVAAGLTQTDLAHDRFSKEYISQIERGKTRPTPETIIWLAERLGVDGAFLEHGVSIDERARVEAALARAAALVSGNEYEQALSVLAAVRPSIAATGATDLQVRALSGEARAHVYTGEVTAALAALARARELVEQPGFTDLDRAEIVFQLGVCRCKLSSISTAIALFDEALRLAETSHLPSDALRARILDWRARCYRQQRDYVAARDDVERALELAKASHDPRAVAHGYFEASLIAERQGNWIQARTYAESARAKYEELADRESVAKLLNNLGGLQFLLGNPAGALSFLKESFSVALELGSTTGAGLAVASLAQVNLAVGQPVLAEDQARQALEMLDGRSDFLHQIGSAQLVLGRALLEQGKFGDAEVQFRAADGSFEQFSSISHRAGVWLAQGDLATSQGNATDAARLYRKAAEALQEVRF